jgi:hypothetical protein
VRRVRLALVRTALLATCLLALVVVPGASAAGRGREAERELSIEMHVGGFRIKVDGGELRGRQNVDLFVSRRRQYAQYVVPAEITDSTIKAKFGSLGEIDYSFAPQGSANLECPGAGGSEVNFTGTFNFTGENGYIHIDADHAAGTYSLFPEPSTCGTQRAEGAATSPRAAPYQPYVGEGATLGATTLAKTTNGSRRLRALTVSRGEATKETQTSVSGLLAELDHGVSILRGVTIMAPARAFEWDYAEGTATVSPPAPFSGTATFIRRADGWKAFTGSLRMPILGIAKPVSMAGGAFHATLHRGVPHED